MKIAIAGASGFIGKALTDKIIQYTQWNLVGLTRSQTARSQARFNNQTGERIEWRQVDLFSLLETEEALKGVDCVFYLVHSMLPSADLDQGSFEDYDLLLADNFARACEKMKVKHLVYLGGIVPQQQELSGHLRSRLEVETVFHNRTFTYTVLRAGLVIGAGGSSFNIMYNLINRIPVLACPSWSQNPMTPIDLNDVVSILVKAINPRNSQYANKTYDVGGPETFSYFNLLKICAEEMNKKRLFVRVPFAITGFSKLWVRLFSGANKELVYPLLDSLTMPMKVDEKSRFPDLESPIPYRESLRAIMRHHRKVRYSKAKFKKNLVRSLQRMPLPKGKNADQVAREYMNWLPKFLKFLIYAHITESGVDFGLINRRWVVLKLRYSDERSESDRALFYITGGLLVRKNSKARLEFREVLNGTSLIVGIHDFKPRLPWIIYRYTQALMHRWVMARFQNHLEAAHF